MHSIKKRLKTTSLYYKWLVFKLRKDLDPEMALLPVLCDPLQASIDVGAANGVYTRKILLHSAYCYAFEPVPDRAERLSRALVGKATVYPHALSRKTGMTQLNMPLVKGESFFGRATIEPENDFSGFETISFTVKVGVLDDYSLPPCGFIKVDVEGHELAVLEGASTLIRRDLPTILVEAEERHRNNAVNSLRDFLEPIGYHGYFLRGKRLRPISEFVPSVDQDMNNAPAPGNVSSVNYVNNFIFIARENVIVSLMAR